MRKSYDTFTCHPQSQKEEWHAFSIPSPSWKDLLKIKKQKLGELLGQNNLEFTGSHTACISNPDSPCLCHVLVMPICSDRDQRKKSILWDKMQTAGWTQGRKIKIMTLGGPEWQWKREKRNVCFPILINLGNKSEHVAKNSTRWKETL